MMNQKKLTVIAVTIFASLIFICAAPSQNGFTISGHIKGLNNTYIYLNWQQGDSVKIDSSMVKAGTFRFKGRVADPSLAVVFLKREEPVLFYLENRSVEMKGEVDSLKRLKIRGSVTQDEFVLYQIQMKGVLNGDQAMDKTISFITNHPNSYVSVDKLQELAPRMDSKTLERLFNALGAPLKSSVAGKRLAAKVDIYKNTAVGSISPIFTQKDVNGEIVSLQDLRGKYVLLDFWASWCGPCRKENPTVLKAYNKFHDKGLTVLAVSLDDNETKWKKAIQDDQMPWIHVSDLKGTGNAVALQYGIYGIPANYLIDPNGKIIGKNLRGEELEKTLATFIF